MKCLDNLKTQQMVMQQVATDTFLRHKLNQLYEQFVNNQNCDILLRIEGKLIQAHSCIIASASTKLDQIVKHHQNKLIEKGFIKLTCYKVMIFHKFRF